MTLPAVLMITAALLLFAPGPDALALGGRPQDGRAAPSGPVVIVTSSTGSSGPGPALREGGVPLSRAVEAAWQRAAEARDAEAPGPVARARREAAARLLAAAPALELSHRQQNWAGSGRGSESEIGLALPLWLPGQRQARLAAVDAEEQLVGSAVRAARLQLAGQVRESAWQIATAQGRQRSQAAQVDLLARLVRDVQRRVAAGDLAHADALAARAEWLEARDEFAEATQGLAEARSRWQVLTGLDVDPDIPGEALAGDPPTAERHPDLHPDLERADLAVEHARRRLTAVDHDRREPPAVLVRLRQDADAAFGHSQNSLGFGLRIPLGDDLDHGPRRAAATTALDVAVAAGERTRDRLAADQQLAQDGVQVATGLLDTASRRASLLRERAGLVQRSFDVGETSLPELLRVLAASSQASLVVAQRQAALGLARARLQQARGLLP